MKIRNVIDYVDELYENVFSETIKLRWLNQLEAELQTEVLLLAAEGITQYTQEDMDAELIAPAPFDKIYEEYLIWRMMTAQGEAERANNQQVVLDEAWKAYARFVAETVDPKNGLAQTMRYYLSAYQVAVKHGYAGTEVEWVTSLKGDKGEAGAGLNIKGQVETDAQLPALDASDEGTAYLVGTGAEALLYIWDGNAWFYKQPLSVKGDPGYTPQKGVDYFDGKDGYTPQKGIDYFDGKDGYTPQKGIDYTDGKDGYTPQKGIDYTDGEDGVGITDIQKRTAAGREVMYITLSDGTEKGIALPVPENGKDYVLTDADREEIARQAAQMVDVPEQDTSGFVQSVNGIEPDADGNVEIEASAQNVVNVKDYGATGDGVTDDTAAIAAAIADLATGETLYFPEGVYRVSNIDLKSDMTVRGDGWCSVIKLLDNLHIGIPEGVTVHHNCLNMVGSRSNLIRNIIIRDIKLDGNRWADGGYKQASTGPSADSRLDGLHIRFATDIDVENVWMYNNGYHGCIMTYATNVTFRNCKATDNGFRPIHGHTHIYNCRVSNCLCENNGLGVQGGSGMLNDSVFFFGAQYLVINDNIIKSNRRGCITVECEQAPKGSADYIPTSNITISGNVCECYEDLAYVNSTESDTGLTKFSSQGIVVIGGPAELVNVAVTGNTIRNAHEAINLYSLQETDETVVAHGVNTTVSGNTIIDCSFGVFAENVADVIIADNQFKNLAIRWAFARNLENAVIQNNNVNSLDISETELCIITESKNVVIRDNNLVGNCASAVYAPGSNTGVIVADNTLRGFLSVNPVTNVNGLSFGNVIDGKTDDNDTEGIKLSPYTNAGFVRPTLVNPNTGSTTWSYTTPAAITDADIRYEQNNYVTIGVEYTDPAEYDFSSAHHAIVFLAGTELTSAVGIATLANGVGTVEFSKNYEPGTTQNTWGYRISISAEKVRELFPTATHVMMQTLKITSDPDSLNAWYFALNDGHAYVYRPKYAKPGDIPTDDHINSLINSALGVIENGTY